MERRNSLGLSHLRRTRLAPRNAFGLLLSDDALRAAWATRKLNLKPNMARSLSLVGRWVSRPWDHSSQPPGCSRAIGLASLWQWKGEKMIYSALIWMRQFPDGARAVAGCYFVPQVKVHC